MSVDKKGVAILGEEFFEKALKAPNFLNLFYNGSCIRCVGRN
jgi:hypothetical protein